VWKGSPNQLRSSAAAMPVAALKAGVCRPLCVYIRPIPCPQPTRPNVRWVSLTAPFLHAALLSVKASPLAAPSGPASLGSLDHSTPRNGVTRLSDRVVPGSSSAAWFRSSSRTPPTTVVSLARGALVCRSSPQSSPCRRA
jgi:hypothetical protein